MPRNRVAITGACGLLGRALVPRLLQRGYRVVAGYHRVTITPADGLEPVALDLESRASAAQFAEHAKADWIIHAAAMTDVDGCNVRPQQARALNATGTENLMEAVSSLGIRVICVSTDYVFDGTRGPYDERAEPSPINVYGQTKYEGEQAVLVAGGSHAIVRSAGFLGIGGPARPTFAESMLRRLTDDPPLPVARDQFANVTPVGYLADAIIEIGERVLTGIWHVAGSEILSRLEFARRLVHLFMLPEDSVRAVDYADLQRAAPRPLNGGLISCRTLRTEQPDLPTALIHWKEMYETVWNVSKT